MRRLPLLASFVYLWTLAAHAQVVGPGFVDYVTSAPSGACSQGAHQQNVLGSGAVYTCQSGTWAAVGGSAAFSSITAGTNPNALLISGSLVPSGTGQISGITNWFNIAPSVAVPPAPTLTGALTGGTLVNGSLIYVSLTFVGAPTIAPGSEVTMTLDSTHNCASGNACSVTVTMPSVCTSPTAPVTGCTVWSSNTINAEKQQTASAACVNITSATCVIGTLGTGAALTTPTSTGINPPNFQARVLPETIIPSVFGQKSDNNFYPLAGMDTSALNIISCCFTGATTPLTGPSGTFTWLDRFFVNDDTVPPPISNVLVSIKHQSGNSTGTRTTPGAGIDDRALGIRIDNNVTANPNYEQYLGQYNEAFVDNNATTCAPVGVLTGESCVAAGRFVATDNRSAASTTIKALEGVVGVVSSGVGGGTGFASCSPCFVGVRGAAFESVNSTNLNNGFMVGVMGAVGGSTPNSSGTGADFYAPYTNGTRFATQNIGLDVLDFSSNAFDWAILVNSSTPGVSSNVMLQGATFLNQIYGGNSTLPIGDSINVTGGITTTQLTTPATPGVNQFGTPGAASVSYKATCADSNGGETAATAAANTGASNANITASNGNNINFASQKGCTAYNVYRTSSTATCNGSGCTNGKIGSVTVPATDTGTRNTVTFQDTGQVGDGNTAVTQPNSTGSFKAVNLGTPLGVTSGNIVSGISVSVSPVTVNANVITDQNGMAVTVSANILNVANRTIRIWLAGVYSTPAASTAVVNHKFKLCTVSGCASGTVINLINISTTALGGIQATNDQYNLTAYSSTQTAGTSSAYEAHGRLVIDLGIGNTVADSVFSDTNTATVGTIDSTGQLFLQHTISFSAGSTSNTATDRQMTVEVVN